MLDSFHHQHMQYGRSHNTIEEQLTAANPCPICCDVGTSWMADNHCRTSRTCHDFWNWCKHSRLFYRRHTVAVTNGHSSPTVCSHVPSSGIICQSLTTLYAPYSSTHVTSFNVFTLCKSVRCINRQQATQDCVLCMHLKFQCQMRHKSNTAEWCQNFGDTVKWACKTVSD